MHSRGVVLDVDYDARGLLSGRVLLYGPIEGTPLAAGATALSTLVHFSRWDGHELVNVKLGYSFRVS